MATKFKNEYYYDYKKIIEELEKTFPNHEQPILNEQEKKKLFPEMMIGESFACHGQQVASFYKKDMLGDSNEIKGDLEQSNDKLSIKINGDDTIDFITATAVEYGETEGDKWKILTNNELTLITQDVWQDNVVSTLTISKETGLGIWQKTTASGLPMNYKIPNGLMVYLQCYLPKAL
ncbi:MAG: hypothetical protein ABIE14_05375 [Patescibacteria group bacterium]